MRATTTAAPKAHLGSAGLSRRHGRIEGTNNLLQVLRRTAHGFTNPDNFAARGLLIT